MRRICLIAIAIATIIILAGCGGGVEQAQPRREVPGISAPSEISESPGTANVNEISHKGWKALELSNNLVTVIAVPEVGGRVMDYRVGDRSLLWINPAEVGSKYIAASDEGQRRFPDFGGLRVFPAPVEKWDGPADPVGSSLTSGNWTYEILSRRGRKVEVEMTSPPDPDHTGLQITRTLRLYADSTHLQIVDAFENVGETTVNWSIQAEAKVPAQAGEETATRAYLPLNPDSSSNRRFIYIDETDVRPFEPLEDDSLLEVTYRGTDGAIGADSMEGWVASVAAQDGYSLVQRFSPNPLEDYPNEGSTVTIGTSADPSCMSIGVASPIYEIVPGDSSTHTIDCYVTTVDGPVRDTTETVAIIEPITVTKDEDSFSVTGKVGAFAPGKILVYLQDKKGNLIGEQVKIDAMIGQVTEVDATLKAEKVGQRLVVELENPQGSPLGEVFAKDVTAKLAREDGATGEETPEK